MTKFVNFRPVYDNDKRDWLDWLAYWGLIGVSSLIMGVITFIAVVLLYGLSQGFLTW